MSWIYRPSYTKDPNYENGYKYGTNKLINQRFGPPYYDPRLPETRRALFCWQSRYIDGQNQRRFEKFDSNNKFDLLGLEKEKKNEESSFSSSGNANFISFIV